MTPVNPNALWAQAFVEELARAGLRHVVIAPGSRSTPLVFAFAEQKEIQVYSQIDERGAGFFALGLANALEQPVALLCTSGTAAAEFFPAIVEAHYSAVPLIVLTADRAPELRDSGANQTVDQIKLFGDHVNWFYEVALPESRPPAIALRNLRALAHRAYAVALGQPNGVVHLNFPFRKPLEPTPVTGGVAEDTIARSQGSPFVSISRGVVHPTKQQLNRLVEAINAAERGIIICGPRCPRGNFPEAAWKLSRKIGFPVLADPLSGVRYGSAENSVIGGFETIVSAIADLQAPDVVIQFGALPTSQALESYLTANAPEIWIQVSADGRWQDPNFLTTDFIEADPSTTVTVLINHFERHTQSSPQLEWLRSWIEKENVVRKATEDFTADRWFDGVVLQRVIALVPGSSHLVVGSSLPVRHLDQFGWQTNETIHTYANRGASGIDGTLASAAGIGAANPEQPLIVVLGDLAFYHDLNSLLTFARAGVKVTIVVINNDGGGIFRRLPVAQFEPTFTELFLTPHGLQFKAAAGLFGMDYVSVNSRTEFDAAFANSFNSTKSVIIEVPTNSSVDLALRAQFLDVVTARLEEERLAAIQEDIHDELG